MKRSLWSGLVVTVTLSAFAPSARADFASCVGSLSSQAARDGISAKTLDIAFNGLEPDAKVLDLQKQQPEFKTPVWDYVDGLVDDDRVADGKAAMAREGRALARAEEKYGVPRTMLAAIWGVESNFGQEMGKRSLVQSLTTLACMGDRASYFRSELMATLKIIDRGDVPAEKLNGSWAGAFGQTQFMPSTFLRLAVDFEGDGRRDIVDSAPDALASTANYFVKSGWRRGLAWGFEVKLPDGYSGPSGRKTKQSMSFWASRGLDSHRRAPARRGRRRAPHTRGTRGAGLSGDAQFRRRLFLQRRRILHPRRLRARRPPQRRTRHCHPLADRRSCSCRARGERNCRRCSRGAAMTSAATRTGTSEPRARPRSPISSSERGSRSTAALRSRCWRR